MLNVKVSAKMADIMSQNASGIMFDTLKKKLMLIDSSLILIVF